MRILLSAYACEPNKGSEPGVGWGWAVELAKHHEVWVITRANNQNNIETYQTQHPEYLMESLQFIYVGLPTKWTFWKKGRRGMRLFYMLWQKKALKTAQEWHDKVNFDLVQHVTFVSYTQPSYMYKLGIPLIWGPIAGGENIPKCIKIEMTLKERMLELVRSISQNVALLSPSTIKMMQKSNYILVATEETFNKIPSKFRSKTEIVSAIGLEKMPSIQKRDRNDGKIKIVMAGRLIYWKAFDIGIKAFLKLVGNYPNVELHILGEGNQKTKLMNLAGEYLNKQIFFVDPVKHDSIFEFYSQYDLYLNTSLRDSGCMTMMEAMSVGLPSICIGVGGPKVLANNGGETCLEPSNYNDSILSVESALRCKFEKTKECKVCSHNLETYSNKYQNLKEFYFVLNKLK